MFTKRVARRVLDGPVLNRTAPCFQSETEGVVSSRGLLLGGRHVVHVSPSLGCRQSRALVGERLGRADSSHRRQRRPFGCATSPYSSTMAPQSAGCPILSQSWCLKLVFFFFCKNAVRISHPFFGHDFVADYRPSLGFEGAARRVDQIMSPFFGHESSTIFIRNLWGAGVFFCEARRSFSSAANAARPQPAGDARSVAHAA